MKIFFITSSSNKSGGSRQALYLAQGLEQKGHELTFFVPEDAELPLLAPEFNWKRLPPKRKKWREVVFGELPNEPCVLHAFHNKGVKLAAWWGLFLRPRGVLVAAQRGVVYKPNNPLPYWSPGIDCFMVNSQACADVLHKKGVGRRRLHLVYNGIPQDRISPKRRPEEVRAELGVRAEQFLFGTVANDSANKGVHVLLHAFARKDIANAKLVVIGVSKEKWLPQCKELDIENRVVLLPRLESVADYVQAFDGFIISSLSESMPNTLQEAMCLGRPVIATSVGGVPECVRGNGFLVPPNNAQALSSAMLEMQNATTEQRRKWGENSLAFSKQFAFDTKIKRVETIYSNIMTQRNLANMNQ